MHPAAYYRNQAERARRLARAQTNHETKARLRNVALDYDHIADNIEAHAIGILDSQTPPKVYH